MQGRRKKRLWSTWGGGTRGQSSLTGRLLRINTALRLTEIPVNVGGQRLGEGKGDSIGVKMGAKDTKPGVLRGKTTAGHQQDNKGEELKSV